MATRLYLHNAAYDRATFTGKYNQGVNNLINYTGYYAGGKHFVGGDTNPTNGSLQYSLNGVDWNNCTITGNFVVSDVYYSGSLYVMADTQGRIYSSADGITWTLRFTDPSARFLERVRYKNNIWVVVGDTAAGVQGCVFTSTDGINWSGGNIGTATNVIGVDYSPTLNLWVAVGSAGAIWTTSDPAGTWTNTTSGAASRYNIYWDSSLSLFITGGVDLIETSTNGTTWTPRAPVGFAENVWGITKVDDTLVVSGTGGALLTSTNGTTWTTRSPSPNPTPDSVNTLYAVWPGESAGANTYLYATGGVSMVYRSADKGLTWETVGSELSTATPDSDGTSIFDTSMSRLRLMNTSIGTAQTNTTLTSASLSTLQQQFCAMFATLPLDSNQTVGGGTMILNTAQNADSAAAAFSVNALNIYVWRPRTGTIVGYVRDSGNASLGGGTGGTGITVQHITGITTSAVSAQKGDIVVCEIWANSTQSMASPYVCNFYFDGTTVNTTQGATVTNHASFVELTENLTFSSTPVTFGSTYVVII
jgi:hypothetical protein